MSFKGKTILVTGASTGIGRATAVEFAKQGAKVMLTARNIKGLEETRSLIENFGGDASVIIADLNNLSEVKSLVSAVKKGYTELFAIINIASVWHTDKKVLARTNYEDFSGDEVSLTMNVGLIAPMLLVHGLLPLMKDGGKILNLSGTFESGAKGWVPYFVSKQALEKFTVGLSEDLAGKNVQVNCVSPSDR